MRYSISKLDHYHLQHLADFSYKIDFSLTQAYLNPIEYPNESAMLNFDQCRRWFNDTFGQSEEAETRADLIISTGAIVKYNGIAYNRDWAFRCSYKSYCIYVRSDKELNWFVLSHPNRRA
jgi:hypothetical protein